MNGIDADKHRLEPINLSLGEKKWASRGALSKKRMALQRAAMVKAEAGVVLLIALCVEKLPSS